MLCSVIVGKLSPTYSTVIEDGETFQLRKIKIKGEKFPARISEYLLTEDIDTDKLLYMTVYIRAPLRGSGGKPYLVICECEEADPGAKESKEVGLSGYVSFINPPTTFRISGEYSLLVGLNYKTLGTTRNRLRVTFLEKAARQFSSSLKVSSIIEVRGELCVRLSTLSINVTQMKILKKGESA